MMESWSTVESLEHKEKEKFIDWENQYKMMYQYWTYT